MFEALCALLLRLYPSEFRRVYGREAAQLMADRACSERGGIPRARLLMDLAIDISTTWFHDREFHQPPLASVEGPHFVLVDTGRPHPTSFALGIPVSLLMLSIFTLLFEPKMPPTTFAFLVGQYPDQAPLANSYNAAPTHRCQLTTTEMLRHRVGYLKLNGFPSALHCRRAFAFAMASLNDAKALVLDLRDNRDAFGNTTMQIASYLFDRPTSIMGGDLHSFAARTASPVPGNKLADKPVFVLTSSNTQSAAEYFVHRLKILNRVTVVGERTAGRWNLMGVEPDLKVSSSEAVETARRLAETRIGSDWRPKAFD